MIKISLSILAGDFAKLGNDVEMLQKNGADMIHLDIMDGNFVPQITFGARMVSALRKHTILPLDVHLMIENPGKHIKDFAEAGSDIITFHAEAADNKRKILNQIKSFGLKAGISLKPDTKIAEISDVINICDLVLIMTVEPGKGGQDLIPKTLDKIKKLRKLAPNLDIQVDGGLNDDTIKPLLDAGANIIVAGSYIFNAEDRKAQIDKLKNK